MSPRKHELPCGHDIAEVREVAETVLVFWQELPKGPYYDAADAPAPTGAYAVKCRECGRHWRIGRRAARPKWFVALLDSIKDGD